MLQQFILARPSAKHEGAAAGAREKKLERCFVADLAEGLGLGVLTGILVGAGVVTDVTRLSTDSLLLLTCHKCGSGS